MPSSPSSFDPSASAPTGRNGVPPLDWAHRAGAADLVEREMNARVGRKRRRRRFALGVIAAAAALGAVGTSWRVPRATPATEAIVTGSPAIVQSPARQVLPDGSVVELKDGARIEVFFQSATRRVVLAQGEAHFQVAKDPGRPFIVAAGGVEVRAVGTAFSVQLAPARVEVLVSEGRVAVASPPPDQGAPTGPPVILDAGNRCLMDTAPAAPRPSTVHAVSPAEMAECLAWRVPRLELNFTPLAEVIPVFNQHGAARLTLADDDLGRLKLSGTLRADNIPVLLRILEISYQVKAEHRASGEIVLARAK